MKKFVWRLQKVLDVNLKKQQVVRTKLLKISEKLALARTNLLTQQRILQDLIDETAALEDAERLGRQELLLKSTRKNDELIKEYMEEVDQLEHDRKQLTDEFMKIRRFTEAMKKLKEKDKQEFITEQEKLEQKEMDEYTSMKVAGEIIQGKQTS